MAIFQTFFKGNIRQENVFYVFLERKNAFLGYKKKKFQKSKNWHFSKGVNRWFWSKNGHFSIYIFLYIETIGQEDVLYDILEGYNAFPSYKNQKFKKSKIEIFPKGLTHGFGPRMAIFPSFLLKQYRRGRFILQYPRTMKRLSKL